MINEELQEEGSVFIVNRFAENLKAYRKAEKLSQGALAELLKLSPQSISKWERGESYPDIEKLVALSDIFKVSVDCLVGHSNEHKKIMIAVDGGGTKTEFIMFSEDGVILEHLKLGGCNPNSVGIEASVEILCRGIDTFLNICHDVCGIYIGAAGVLLGTGASALAAYLLSLLPKIKPYSPASLMNSAGLLVGAENTGDYTKSAIVTAVMCAVCVILSIPVFNKKEI